MYPGNGVDWQQALMDWNNVDPQLFVCPCAPKGQTCYYYVPGHQTALASNQVLVYEDPANHGGQGGNVLFVDSHVEFINAPKYQALINSLKLPDGTPWAPHLAAEKSTPGASADTRND
jgi:prepilin-type processing-associated H-X9-DG protein